MRVLGPWDLQLVTRPNLGLRHGPHLQIPREEGVDVVYPGGGSPVICSWLHGQTWGYDMVPICKSSGGGEGVDVIYAGGPLGFAVGYTAKPGATTWSPTANPCGCFQYRGETMSPDNSTSNHEVKSTQWQEPNRKPSPAATWSYESE